MMTVLEVHQVAVEVPNLAAGVVVWKPSRALMYRFEVLTALSLLPAC